MQYIPTSTVSDGTRNDQNASFLKTEPGTRMEFFTDGRVTFSGPGSYHRTIYSIRYLARLRLFELMAIWIRMAVHRDEGNGWDRYGIAGYAAGMSSDKLMSAILNHQDGR